MIFPASNPRVFSRIAKCGAWRLFTAGIAVALGVSGAWGQETSNSSKRAAANEDLDLALDVFTSPDDSMAVAPPRDSHPPASFFPVFLGAPGFSNWARVGFLNTGTTAPLTPVVLGGPFTTPFSNGVPIAAVGPLGTPLGGSNEFSRGDSFDVMKQPSAFKYTGSEIDLLYGFSSNGASIRAAGFVTSMASDTTQIVVGATFSDQSGLTFPAGRYTPYGNSKFSSQTQQYFAGINYKLFGGAMILGVDFAVADTKLNGNFRPINRANQAVVNPNNVGNPKSYSTQLGLSGALPGNMAYQVGVGFDQATTSGNDISDLRSLMTPRRR
jgi:hypothetical protein